MVGHVDLRKPGEKITIDMFIRDIPEPEPEEIGSQVRKLTKNGRDKGGSNPENELFGEIRALCRDDGNRLSEYLRQSIGLRYWEEALSDIGDRQSAIPKWRYVKGAPSDPNKCREEIPQFHRWTVYGFLPP